MKLRLFGFFIILLISTGIVFTPSASSQTSSIICTAEACMDSPLQIYPDNLDFPPRIFFEGVENNLSNQFNFPIGLIGDILPPVITNGPTINIESSNSISMLWFTDEYSDATVNYGTTTGDYPYFVSNASYYRRHDILISELNSDTIYYYIVTSTDRSGNDVSTTEQSFKISPSVYFDSNTYSVVEQFGSAPIDVYISVSRNFTVTVDYETSGASAIAGLDYIEISGTLIYPPGQTSNVIFVPVLNDKSHELDEALNLNLYNPNNATLGTPSTASLTIYDNDPSPVISFSSSTYNINEAEITVPITVNLTNSSEYTVTVEYDTSDGTATAGQDYIIESGIIDFSPGVISETINIAILDDTFIELDETINFILKNPVNGSLGTPFTSIFTIVDFDFYPYFLPIIKR